MDFEPDLRNVKWMNGWMNMPEAFVRVKTPGVTTIINDMIPNPEIDQWIKDVGQEQADKITAASHQRGTSMHLFIENFLKELKKSGDPSSALKYTQTFTPPALEKENIPSWKIKEGRDLFYNFYDSDYAKDYKSIVGAETNIYSPKFFYRGKIDWTFIMKMFGIGIRDFKTSSKPIIPGSRKELGYKIQLGAYAGALEDMYSAENKDVKIGYASIVSMQTKSNLVQNIECSGDELDKYKMEFKTLATQWHIKNGQGFLVDEKLK